MVDPIVRDAEALLDLSRLDQIIPPRWYQAQDFHAQSADGQVRLRELLVAVAQELERMASEDREVPGRDRLLRRAMRIRQRLHL